MKLPRIMIAAVSSGSGKTLITCGMLAALKRKGISLASFKCGPDYIDPMFHKTVLELPSRNLDSFFAEPELLRSVLAEGAKGAELAVTEGVMGYYDGAGFHSTAASSYEVARQTGTPVLLVINARGMSLSAVAAIKGFMDFRADSNIQGVIFNNISRAAFDGLKPAAEEILGIRVCGYVPHVADCQLESRHLGLVTPQELQDIRSRLDRMADVLEDTLDLELIQAIAGEAPELEDVPETGAESVLAAAAVSGTESVPAAAAVSGAESIPAAIAVSRAKGVPAAGGQKIRIAVAMDEAFCFYYEDNLDLLKSLGAELVPFSPIRDRRLPKDCAGLLLGGGYPELYLESLSKNTEMLSAVKEAVENGMPCIAECGGFLYLHERMEDMNRKEYPAAGVIHGTGLYTGKLGRFGYIDVELQRDQMFGGKGMRCRGHEFHYYDSTENGQAAIAKKPMRKRSWECMHGTDNLEAGFPHLYYKSNPVFAENFLKKCKDYKRDK